MSQQIINIGTTPGDGTGDYARTSFDKCNQNFTELYQKGAGSATEGLWNFNQISTDTTTSPATGRFRTNTGNFSTATQLAIHQNTINGIDRSQAIRTQLVGDLIQCQDPGNANSWCRYRITSLPVDNSTWFQINIALEGSGAVAPSDNREILFTFTANSGGGGSTITAVATSVAVQKFTASGTYTPNPNLISAVVECVGGGGGGGGSSSGAATASVSGGGGGSGGYSRTYLTAAQIGASQTITIGAAGNGATAGFNNGTAGTATSLGTLCIANGGGGGGGNSSTTSPYLNGPGAGATPGTGDIVAAGAPGACGGQAAVMTGFGEGGSSIFGGAGRTPTVALGVAANGTAASNYGSGGSGGVVQQAAGNAAGGNGSAGLVIITEYVAASVPANGPVPTYQTFLSGSGTYTTPVGVRQIEVTLVGGGGGGGGANNGAVATSGGATTFGAGPLFSAGGGAGGSGNVNAFGGAGGTVSGSGTPIWSQAGGTGNGGSGSLSANYSGSGGTGGNSTMGGTGAGGYGVAGGNAPSNSGGGGGGGAPSSGQTLPPGLGGGAGATVFAVINSPAATYSYAVGSGGAGLAGGTSGFGGGNGAAGIIIVKELY